MYDVYSEFDLEKHKQTFINYLEVCIHPDGSIHYAVPSHQRYLENLAVAQHGGTYQEFLDSVPCEWYADYLNYLINITKCVVVWSHGYQGNEFTAKQIKSLRTLMIAGILKNNRLH